MIHYEIFGLIDDMKFEVSLRKGRKIEGELITIVSDFTIPYNLIHLPPIELIQGKMEDLLSRKKPRDYYDLYFMLRHRELNKHINKRSLKTVLANLSSERIDFKKELFALLPVSQHLILKNFKEVLKKEIEKYYTAPH